MSPIHQSKRISKRKKGKGSWSYNKMQSIEKKVQTLGERLNLVPFSPSKKLDFSKHEELLKRIGLWDFVHTDFEFDRSSIPADLIAQLIVTYDPKARCSYVNTNRIMVNRADLARALKLPVKKQKSSNLVRDGVDLSCDALSEESVAFVDDFLSNWMLLHGDADSWIMPDEVVNLTRPIKEGHLKNMDWAALLWFMVEKELMKGEQLVDCYYASHLQYLIRSQQRELLLRELEVDHLHEELESEECDLLSNSRDEGENVDYSEKLEDEEDACNEENVKTDDVDEVFEEETDVLEVPNVELTSGQKDVEEEEVKDGVMVDVNELEDDGDVEQRHRILDEKDSLGEHFGDGIGIDGLEENKEEGDDLEGEEVGVESEVKDGVMVDVNELEDDGDVEQRHWILDEKDSLGEHFGDGIGLDGLEENKEEGDDLEGEEVGVESDDGFDALPAAANLHGDELTGNLLESMETTQMPFGFQGQLNHESSIAHNNLQDMATPGPSLYNYGKRKIVHEHDISHHSFNGDNKRVRLEGPRGSQEEDLGTCLNRMGLLVEKAQLMYLQNAQEQEQSSMNRQILLKQLQERDIMIEHLHNSKRAEIERRDEEICILNRELFILANLLEEYRKALKHNDKSFSEYRKRCQLPEEPIYKDAGPGGLVLSITDIEKRRKKEEEEFTINCAILEEKARDTEEGYALRFGDFSDKVEQMKEKLAMIESTFKSLKDSVSRHKVLETSPRAAGECCPIL